MESRLISLQDCRIQSVTVYLDRAEVVRKIDFQAEATGEHEIKISGLSESLNKESIRVRGLCSCQILEVSHELVVVDDADIPSESVKQLKLRITELEKKQKRISQQKKRLQDQQKHTERYTEFMLYGSSAPNATGNSKPPVSEATAILSFNMSEMTSLDEKINDLEEEYNKIDEEISVSRAEVSKCFSAAKEVNRSYTVSVLVDVKEAPGIFPLDLTYVVSDTTWSPSYDIRVSTSTNVMDITYFADVTQSTGEDWTECELFLSTSNPSMGAAPPPLPLRTVDWSYKIQRRRRNSSGINSKAYKSIRDSYSDCDYRERAGSFSLMENFDENPRYNNLQQITNVLPTAPPIPNEGGVESALTSGISGSGEAGATTFTIHRLVNIASDSKPHKVTVTSESFSPQMVHYVSPNIDASAYQQAKVVNTSRYPLLPSEKVSVFMDGNFISTSTMRLVSPGESFNIFLGVDPALKVEYRPCRTSTKTKGLWAGTEVKQYNYCTVLRNTKQSLCRVIVAEILPRSSDEQISVELLEPAQSALVKLEDSRAVSLDQDIISGLDSMSHQGSGGEGSSSTGPVWPADFITQNKVTNNVIWLKSILPGEKATIHFKYRLLWPKGESVDIM